MNRIVFPSFLSWWRYIRARRSGCGWLYFLRSPHHFVWFGWCGGGLRSVSLLFAHHFLPWWCGNNLWCFFFLFWVVLFLLWPLFVFFIFLDEVVHQLRLYLNLLYALWIRPIVDMDHGALLLPWPKVKLLFFAIDVEADFSGSNNNLCSCGAEEWSPQDEGRLFCSFHVQHHKID